MVRYLVLLPGTAKTIVEGQLGFPHLITRDTGATHESETHESGATPSGSGATS
jgi:hypothetical protein